VVELANQDCRHARSLSRWRLAVTALSLMACVLLIAMWVRSLWWQDSVNIPGTNTKNLFVGSRQGRIAISMRSFALNKLVTHHDRIDDPKQVFVDDLGNTARARWIQVLRWRNGITELIIPYWMVAIVAAALACLPWLRWKFSLRTLLIATTLVAAGLGAIVAAT
jgi:hypothetical protein